MKSKKQKTPVKNRRLDGYAVTVGPVLYCTFIDHNIVMKGTNNINKSLN